MVSETIQTIARLTPLAEVLALIDREVKPIAPRSVEPGLALGSILATDVTAPLLPRTPIAILDGRALVADNTLGAGGYSPVLLPAIPARVDIGQPMPVDTDCVAPLDAVKIVAGRAEVLNTINPGDGVLAAGGDSDGSTPMRRAGERLRALDVAALTAAGVTQVSARLPRLRVVPVRSDPIVVGAAHLIASHAARCGSAPGEAGGELSQVLTDDGIDGVIAVGGTGSGHDDASVQILARAGRVLVHGIALSPGESAAFGIVGRKPVLLLPGRLDAALAVWLTLGRRLLARLAAVDNESNPAETLALSRKVTSAVGMAELVPVRRVSGRAEPLAAKYLSLTVLTRSDGWLLVPAEGEGYSAGTQVQVRPWP